MEEEDVKYDSYSRTLKLALDLGNEAAFSWEMGLMNNNNFRLDLQKLSNGTSCVKDGPKKSLVTCPEAFRKQLVSNIRSKRVCLTDYHQDVTNGTNPWIFCDLSMTAGQVFLINHLEVGYEANRKSSFFSCAGYCGSDVPARLFRLLLFPSGHLLGR